MNQSLSVAEAAHLAAHATLSKLRTNTAAAQDAKAKAVAALDAAMLAPATKPGDVGLLRAAIETATDACMLSDARERRGEAEVAKLAEAVSEAREAEATKLKAEQTETAQREVGRVVDEIAELQRRLDALSVLPGVQPVGLRLVVVRANAHFSSTVSQATVHNIPAALNIPPSAEAVALAAERHASQVAAQKAIAAEAAKFREYIQNGHRERSGTTVINPPNQRLVGGTVSLN